MKFIWNIKNWMFSKKRNYYQSMKNLKKSLNNLEDYMIIKIFTCILLIKKKLSIIIQIFRD